ncbi:MAG: nucleotidyl transferase AbiEii/AbiGii toxin family protein [Patescibacteria group bacterium]
MIDEPTAIALANKQEIDPYTIVREYVQIRFLDVFFRIVKPKSFFFKGGTAIRLAYGSDRFSEDLDFTVTHGKTNPIEQATKAIQLLKAEMPDISMKPVKTIAGQSAKISLQSFASHQPLTIKLDFSLREDVLTPQLAAIKTSLPIAGTPLVDTVSKEEILAEKIRAVINRRKGRDIYDLWYLLHTGTPVTKTLIEKKLLFYHEAFEPKILFDAVASWREKELYQDIAKFLPRSQRRIIAELPRLTHDLLQKDLPA